MKTKYETLPVLCVAGLGGGANRRAPHIDINGGVPSLLRCLRLVRVVLVRMGGLPGHMQPLGSHREPELVPRVSPEISPVEFHRSYVADRKAVILDQVLVRTGIVEKWGSDDYLRLIHTHTYAQHTHTHTTYTHTHTHTHTWVHALTCQ